jgi:hypothetical protein
MFYYTDPENGICFSRTGPASANRVFMSRLFMNLTTNIQRYAEWTAYLNDRQPKQ